MSTINQNPAYTAFLSDYDFLHSYLFPALTSPEIVDQRKDIYNFYANDTPSPKAAAQFLRKSFDSQRSILIHSSDGTACIWIGSNGITTDVSLPEGDYSRKMSWSICEKYIRQLIDDGTYLEGEPARVPQQISLFDSPTPDARTNPKNEAKNVLIPAADPAAPAWIRDAGGAKITMEGDVVTIETLAGPKNDHYVEMDIELPDENPAASPAQEPPQTDSTVKERINYCYADTTEFAGGQKTHYQANVEAVRLLKTIEKEQRMATRADQEILVKYVGWGGIPQPFDKRNDKWSEEYNELKNLLTDEEYTAARASTLTAFYTPPAVISAVHTALRNFGFTGGNILDIILQTLIQFNYSIDNLPLAG